MLSLISFILVCIGSLNWFTIGLLQYDFVAGIFGSQSNIFSRLIYALVGIASIFVIANLIAHRGRFVISFKKDEEEYSNYQESRLATSSESSEDMTKDDTHKNDNK